MASQVFKQWNNFQQGQSQAMPAQNGNSFLNMVNQFNQFRSTFQGDPQQIVQGLLSSGRMTQDQFTQLGQMATEFLKLLPR